MLSKGDTWNESRTHKDPVTGRTIRWITTDGLYNQKPPYHTRTTFTDDGEFMLFATYRDGQSAICRAHVPTGDITVLVDPLDDPPDCEKCELRMNPGTIGGRTRWVYYWREKSLRAVHVDTLEEKVLIERFDDPHMLSLDATEDNVVFSAGADPGDTNLPDYREKYAGTDTMFRRFVSVPVGGGEAREVYVEEGARGGHCEMSPTDPDLLLLDRDLPPMFHAGGDYSKTPRSHVVNIATGEIVPLWPRDVAKFQIHAVWTWDGEFVLYHGPAVLVAGPCPYYIGVVRPSGEVYREWTPENSDNYGHVAAAPDRPAVILDGNLTFDLMQWMYYDGDEPRFEVICEHRSEWKTLPGQLTHPHPSTDRGGRWIALNVCRNARVDVWVVEV
jgi:hypothetical protein